MPLGTVGHRHSAAAAAAQVYVSTDPSTSVIVAGDFNINLVQGDSTETFILTGQIPRATAGLETEIETVASPGGVTFDTGFVAEEGEIVARCVVCAAARCRAH